MQKIGSITDTANSNDEFTDGNVAAGISATLLPATFFNTVQRELVNVVESSGLALDPEDDNQLLAALKQLTILRYDEEMPYELNSIVNSAGILYKSLADNNVNNAVTDTTKWAVIFDTSGFVPSSRKIGGVDLSANRTLLDIGAAGLSANNNFTGTNTFSGLIDNTTGIGKPNSKSINITSWDDLAALKIGTSGYLNAASFIDWPISVKYGIIEKIGSKIGESGDEPGSFYCRFQPYNSNFIYTLTRGNSSSSVVIDNIIVRSDFVQSLAETGYQKLPGGLILQWGRTQVSGDSSTAVVFPVTFNVACFSVVASGTLPQTGSGVTQAAMVCNVQSITGFRIYNDTATQLVNWIAIGA